MAVYTPLTHEQISILLQRYALGTLVDAHGITQGVENTNYRIVVSPDGKERISYILTVYEKRVKESDLPFFMGLLERLAERHILCPRPLRAIDGSVLQSLAGKPATLVTFLQGKEVGKIEPAHLAALGSATAKMHRALEGFAPTRANALSLTGWQQLAAKIMPGADTLAPGLANMIAAELRILQQGWTESLPKGIIHADLFPDNVFFMGEQLTGIIDFYFACNDMLMYELAIVINAWCFERQREFNITKARALLRGYHADRPITSAELDHLPILCRGAALRFLLTRAHDSLFPVEGAQVTPKDPMEYVRKLTFHQSVRHHSEYGL